MILYILYRMGLFLALTLPIRASYVLACLLADIYCLVSDRDRKVVMDNLGVVLGRSVRDDAMAMMARDVFRNFAKYLIDFFRFSKIDHAYVKRNIKIEGIENLDEARAMGNGVIILSAHIGNWELGGAIMSMIGYPISGVVLPHKNRHINDFFNSQRLACNMKPIEMGASLKECYRVLRKNELLALLGDRDFSGNGIAVNFFGKTAMMPKGPAVFSYRLNSPIVPVFLIRKPDDTFSLLMDKPIICTRDLDEEAAIRELTIACSVVIESYVKKYPTQWFVFRNIWKLDDEESVRADTVI